MMLVAVYCSSVIAGTVYAIACRMRASREPSINDCGDVHPAVSFMYARIPYGSWDTHCLPPAYALKVYAQVTESEQKIHSTCREYYDHLGTTLGSPTNHTTTTL